MKPTRADGAVASLLALVVLLTPASTEAQPVELSLSAGYGSYATGDDFNCGSNRFFEVGAEVRSRGPLLVSVGADLLAAFDLDCTAVGHTVFKGDGVRAGELTGLDLGLAPRLRSFVGVRVGIRELELAPAAGVGLVRSSARIREEPRSWRTWLGMRIEGRLGGRGPSLTVEHGWNRVPVLHDLFRYDEQGQAIDLGVDRFHRWRGMTQVMLAITL